MTVQSSVDPTPDAPQRTRGGRLRTPPWRLPAFRTDVGGSRPIDLRGTLRVARVGLAIALTVAASVSLTAAFFSSPALTSLFLPSAVVLLALLATRTRAWWGVIASAFIGFWLASTVASAPADAWGGSLATGIATPLIAAAATRRWLRPASELDSLTWIGSFIVVALLAPVATEGAGTWLVGDAVPQVLATPDPGDTRADAATTWLIIVLANALALLTVVPACLAGWNAFRKLSVVPGPTVRGPRIVEGIALAAACALAGALMLRRAGPLGHPDVVFLVAPAIVTLWGALRFGLGGAAGTLSVVMAVAMHDVVTRHAAGAGFGANDVAAFQLSMAAMAVPILLLAAATADRRQTRRRFSEEEDRSAVAARAGGVYLASVDETTGALNLDRTLGQSLGLSPTEIDQPNWWWCHVHADDVRAVRAFWATRHADEQRQHLDFRMLAVDGSVRWFRIRANAARDGSGRDAPVVGALTDITQLKHAELVAAERNRELAHVARTAIVGELAAALTHEVRQPLTAILINSQTAMRILDARPHDPEAVREILQQLAADGRRAGDVIQRVRGFARKAEPERGPVDVNDVVREAAQLVRHDTIRRRVEIRFALTPEPLVVIGDRVQLQQVVLNLLLNALDALAELPPNAERRISIETTRALRTALVTVGDTGPGIPRERQAAIFEPFVTTKRTGLGMGLAISRIIAAAHGGTIHVESEPGAGAAFVVTVPLGTASAN